MKRFPTKREFECGACFTDWRYKRCEWSTVYQINLWPRVYVVAGRKRCGKSFRETFTTITEARKFMRSAFRADS